MVVTVDHGKSPLGLVSLNPELNYLAISLLEIALQYVSLLLQVKRQIINPLSDKAS